MFIAVSVRNIIYNYYTRAPTLLFHEENYFMFLVLCHLVHDIYRYKNKNKMRFWKVNASLSKEFPISIWLGLVKYHFEFNQSCSRTLIAFLQPKCQNWTLLEYVLPSSVWNFHLKFFYPIQKKPHHDWIYSWTRNKQFSLPVCLTFLVQNGVCRFLWCLIQGVKCMQHELVYWEIKKVTCVRQENQGFQNGVCRFLWCLIQGVKCMQHELVYWEIKKVTCVRQENQGFHDHDHDWDCL